jgi:probable HAF family extracellular repeat protein
LAPAEAWDHAVLWEHGVMTDLGTLPGGSHSFALGINAAGVVAGMSDAGDGQFHAVIWQQRVIRDLGIGQAQGINNRGQVVGIRGLRPTLWSVQ